MATFLHVCGHNSVALIRRNGIRRSNYGGRPSKKTGVFAMPVTADFRRTHQWIRELRRFTPGRLWAAYFRVPDDERVLFGHFLNPPVEARAADVTGLLRNGDGMAFQVIVPRRIQATAIAKLVPLPQLVG